MQKSILEISLYKFNIEKTLKYRTWRAQIFFVTSDGILYRNMIA